MRYSKSKMQKLMKRDAFIRKMYEGLMQGNGNDEDYVLKVIFHSEVLGDSAMERAYNKK